MQHNEFKVISYTWTAGRQLASATTGNERIEYHYNADGMLQRYDLYQNDEYSASCAFIWDGDKLIAKSITDMTTNQAVTSRVIYDSDGEAQGVSFEDKADAFGGQDSVWLYRKNLQGDIIGLYSQEGKLIAEYTYDAYGNVSFHTTSDGLAGVGDLLISILVTPQLYRGYMFLTFGDTVGYYLGSRYYLPELGRFLNADSYEDTGTGVVGTNMFTYCNNNPVMHIDPTGESIAAAAAAVGVPVMYVVGMAAILILLVDVITGGKVMLTFSEAIAAMIAYGSTAITSVVNSNKISNKIKTSDGRVDLDKFKTKLPNGQGYKGPDNWKIIKDMASHGGRAWKLYHGAKKIASLYDDGSIANYY